MRLIFVLIIFAPISGFPSSWIKRIAESNGFDEFDNYLPKFGDLPKFEYSTNNRPKTEEILFKTLITENKKPENLPDKLSERNASTSTPVPSTSSPPSQTNQTHENSTENFDLISIFDGNNTDSNDTLRFPRQQDVDVNKNSSSTSAEKESQEEEDEEDENMITGLLNAFLSGLSRPDGSIDLEAITGLLGSLSVQNPDGTYDFNGLTELLMSFFGGGGEEGGGSDLGAFLGGLVGAILKGSAMPPGPKGAGMFTGKVAAGILPALSGPTPQGEGEMGPQKPLDSGSFIAGFLSSFLGSSSGNLGNSSNSGASSSMKPQNGNGGGSKFSLFKMMFSMITSIFTSSSKSH